MRKSFYKIIKFDFFNQILTNNMISFHSKEAEITFLELSKKLEKYVDLAQIKDEQSYRDFHKNKDCPMAFVQHQPLGGNFNVYRSRMGNSIGADEDITNPATFSYVPEEKCSSLFPPLQRCNFTGQSVFYASMSVKTNFKEIDKESCTGKEVYISKWHIDENANANMFRVIPPEGIDIDEDYKGYLKIDKDKEYPQHIIGYLRDIGNIFMNDRGGKYDVKKYLPCALISNFIYDFNYTGKPIFQGQSSKYDGILYPSVKDQDRCLLNVAFTPRFIDTHVTLKFVVKGTIGEDLMSVKMQEIGFFNGKEIDWYAPTVLVDSIHITKYLYFDDKGKLCEVAKGHLFDNDHKEVKNYYAIFYANINSWMKQMLTIIPNVMGNFDDIEDAISFTKTIDDWGILRELNGWTLELENETINVTKVIYEFDYQVTLEKIENNKK